MSSKADKSGRSGGAAAGIKDVEGIARVLGLELLAQRQRRLKQLAALRELTQRADFPPRVKGLWPRAAVIEFARKFVTVSKSKREFTVRAEDGGWRMEDGAKPSRRLESRPRSADELPAQNSPAEGELFGAAENGLEASLDLWEEKLKQPIKWAGDPIQLWQIKQLEKHRPWLFNTVVDAGGENISGGQRGVAQWIRNNFNGVVCNHSDIARWMKGEYLPHGCTENFPAYEAAGRYKAAAVRAWVEKYLVKHTNGQELPLDTDYRRLQEKLDYERALDETNLWRQSTSHKFMETALVLGFIEGFGTWIGLQQDRLIEEANGVRRLVAEAVGAVFGASPEQLAQLDARLSPALAAANDAMKTATAQHGDELVKQLVQERKESLARALAKAT